MQKDEDVDVNLEAEDQIDQDKGTESATVQSVFSYINPTDSEESDEEEKNIENTDEDDGDGDESEPNKVKNKGWEKRVGKLTKNWKEEQERNKRLELEIQLMKEKFNNFERNIAPPKKEEQISGLVSPKQEDFQNWDEYQEAVIEYKLDIKDQKRQENYKKELDEQKSKAKEQEVNVHLNKRLNDAKDKYGKLWDNVEKLEGGFDKVVNNYLIESDNIGAILVHFSSNKDELKKLKSMSPMQQVSYIAKNEDTILEAHKKLFDTSKTKISKAPDPIKSVKSSLSDSALLSTKDPGNLNFQDFDRWMDLQQKRK